MEHMLGTREAENGLPKKWMVFPPCLSQFQKGNRTMSHFCWASTTRTRSTGCTTSRVWSTFQFWIHKAFTTVRAISANLQAILNFLCKRTVPLSLNVAEQTGGDDHQTDSWPTDAKPNPQRCWGNETIKIAETWILTHLKRYRKNYKSLENTSQCHYITHPLSKTTPGMKAG